jgi:glycosyltransferase involved in cell wall biosynthesis
MAGAVSGGAELFYERLCVASAVRGETILPVIRRNPARAERLRAVGCQPVELRFGGPMDFVTRWQVGRHLRRFAPQVVVAWMSRAAWHTPSGEWALVGRLGGFYDLSYYRRCDHLIGNTQGLVAWIRQQGWPADKVRYLPNFVMDLQGAVPLERESLGVPASVPLLLALGRLHRNKAFDVLICALRHLPEVHLVIAGEGPERVALQRLALSEGVAERVHMPGWASDVSRLLATCDVLVCPSRHEPLGNVVIEGWSARRPVVATRAAGPSELISSGVDGVLVEVEAPEALATALAEVIARPDWGAALALAGRRRFEAEFAEGPVLVQWRAGLAEMVRA